MPRAETRTEELMRRNAYLEDEVKRLTELADILCDAYQADANGDSTKALELIRSMPIAIAA